MSPLNSDLRGLMNATKVQAHLNIHLNLIEILIFEILFS